ncbi:triple tyrosine motif-containing protein [Bacillus sp. EB01]|uniref:triple tyrosine motif-containing protein n=1 Tax=Bacillus sp. EB01 TaxID=1347086 RepID=UPI0005C788DF|nr:triple tyrosine motif-containing protein [Bacillus sp. EB01]
MRKIVLYALAFLLAFSAGISPAAAEGETGLPTDLINKPAKLTGIEFEPNDAIEHASSIAVKDGVEGILQDKYDADFYKIDLPYSGTFRFYSVLGKDLDTHYLYLKRHELGLYDASGNELAVSSNKTISDDRGNLYYEFIEASLQKGSYYIAVKSRNGDGPELKNTDYILFSEADFVSGLEVTGITPDFASPQIERKAITFKSSANKPGLQYQYSIDGKVVRDFSTSNTYTWTPTTPGDYIVKVAVRDPIHKEVTAEKEIAYSIKAYVPDFTITSLTPNIASPYVPNKIITYTAVANKTGLQYQFSVNGKVVQAFGSKTTYAWKPTAIGKYTIKVEVRRSQYPNRIVSKSATYEIKDPNVYITSLKPSAASPYPVNSTIKWTAAAKGIQLEYSFAVYKSGTWRTVQSYSSKNYYSWKPTSAGSYQVKVTVRSKASGKTASKAVSYTAFTPANFSAPTLKANKGLLQKEDTAFTFTANSSGKYLEYRFRVNGVVKKNYSSSKTFSFTPPAKGKYTVTVDVKVRGTSTVKSKTLTLDIRESPSYYMIWVYDYSYDVGAIRVYNSGRFSLKVTKFEVIENGRVVYSESPNWTTYAGYYSDYYFDPGKSLYNISNIRVTYYYDGIKYTTNLYAN